jgi:hypothetical protein
MCSCGQQKPPTRVELTASPPPPTQDAPIPPEKFDEAQKGEADAFFAARKSPVFEPFSVLVRSTEQMTAYRFQGDHCASSLRSAPSFLMI